MAATRTSFRPVEFSPQWRPNLLKPECGVLAPVAATSYSTSDRWRVLAPVGHVQFSDRCGVLSMLLPACSAAA